MSCKRCSKYTEKASEETYYPLIEEYQFYWYPFCNQYKRRIGYPDEEYKDCMYYDG